MSKLFSTASAFAILLPALATAQATPQGAADLTAVLQTYLGTTPGVVNVVAEGPAYAVTLDPAPLFAMIPAEAQVTASVTPQKMLLTDNGDGTWGYTQEQPVNFKLAVPGTMDISWDIGNVACSGTFDAALRAFTESKCVIDNMTTSQVVVDPMSGTQTSASSITRLDYVSSAKAGAAGGVDGVQAYTATGVSQTMSLPLEPGAEPVTITVALDSYNVDGVTTGVRTEAFHGALAWLVANPAEGLMMANRGQIKTILSDGLPLWEKIAATGTASGVAIGTPIGPVSATGLNFTIEMAGAVENGLFREAVSLSGVTPPPGVVPPFAEPLLPTDLSFDIAVESFDAKAAAGLLLGLLDLAPGAAPAPGFDAELLTALLPDGSVDIVLRPGAVKNATYTLSYEGRMQAGPNMMMPTGTAKITATGYDAAMAALDAAPDEVKMEMLPALGIARQFAQEQADGSLVWDIDATVPGTFKVNGMDLMGMQ